MSYFRSFIKGVNEGKNMFGETIGIIVNGILLSLVYLIGVGFTSMYSRIVGKTFLDMEFDKNTKTYWTDYEKKSNKMEEYYRQF